MYRTIRPMLFRLDPETAHSLTISGLALLPSGEGPTFDSRLETRIAGLRFPCPIGLAAGFDKDARAWPAMLRLGFGFVEVGTITPRPQSGNPKPRIFRLAEDRAVINRLGFNNGGLAGALPRIRPHPLLGVNVGANKDSRDRIADYVAGVGAVRDRAAWITLNISSPNTPGLRGLQGDALPELLAAASDARGPLGPPLFLKVAPDLDRPQVDGIVAAVRASAIDGLIISNTTLDRPASLLSRHSAEAGGLSGAPLTANALAMLREFARAMEGEKPLIGVGGIGTAEDVLARVKAGASAVQLYTALIYEGPGIARRLAEDLLRLLEREGLPDLASAVGADLR